MNTACLRIWIICFLVFSGFYINANAEEQDKNRGIGLYLDQDYFIPFSNEDRDYTMGMAAEFFWGEKKGLYPFDGMVKTAGEWLGIKESDKNIIYSFMLGTFSFTPDDLSDPNPIYNDRPYSSLIYLSNKRVRSDGRKAVAAEILLGVIGSKIPGEVQSGFHSWYRDWKHLDETENPVDPKGWRHQISDGGELTFRLRLTKSELHKKLSIPGIFDIATTLGLSLGFQSNANVGFTMRAGNLISPIWSLPYDPVNRGNFVPSKAQDEWYLWSAFNARFVAYDALLQGQFNHSDVTFTNGEIEHVVYDGGVGLTFGFSDAQFTISAKAKSSELKLSPRHHLWGGINLIYYF